MTINYFINLKIFNTKKLELQNIIEIKDKDDLNLYDFGIYMDKLNNIQKIKCVLVNLFNVNCVQINFHLMPISIFQFVYLSMSKNLHEYLLYSCVYIFLPFYVQKQNHNDCLHS